MEHGTACCLAGVGVEQRLGKLSLEMKGRADRGMHNLAAHGAVRTISNFT